MYDRLKDLLTEVARGGVLRARNERASAEIKAQTKRGRKNPLATGPSGEAPKVSPYKVATAKMRIEGKPAVQPRASSKTASGKATTITVK